MRNNNSFISSVAVVLCCIMSLVACSTLSSTSKLRKVKKENITSTIGLPKEHMYTPREIKNVVHKDTIQVVDFEGKQVFLMKTIQTEDGESVANEVLDAAVVTARFRHLAERNGKVDLEFQIVVPENLLDSKWQIRYEPTMYVLGDSIKLDKVYITGKEYRRRQLRGYQQYQRFLDRIITDSTRFIDLNRLEIFIARNIPAVYAFKNDSTVVSDEQFDGLFGVTEREAIEHYTNKLLIQYNERLKSRKAKMYKRYIKSPIVKTGLRLDTVINVNGNYVYNYVQELDIKNKRKLKKVDIVLDGKIYEQDIELYSIPRTEPLTFYISSLSAFVDGTERYIKKVIERKATANASYNIDFALGKSEVNESLGNNALEIHNIKEQLNFLLTNTLFDLDSVVVVASASPEGSVQLNGALSKKRSESITSYFNIFMRRQIDSLNTEAGFSIDENGKIVRHEKKEPIKFKSRYVDENWEALDRLIEMDENIEITQKEEYFALRDIKNPDERENSMKKESWYKYMHDELYPRLRSVRFEFSLSRKGMIKDTIQTTVLDSVYMDGIAALRDRDYELAARLLAPYNDYNTAIAYSSLDRNNSALAILEKCEPTAEVNYMLAIIYSRFGDDQKAVQYYMNSCGQNPSYVHRGNLDPEISVLIKRYNLNAQDDSDLF